VSTLRLARGHPAIPISFQRVEGFLRIAEKLRLGRFVEAVPALPGNRAVPRMDMDLHLARVQQRWRYADDELPAGQMLNLEALAHDTRLLPDSFEGAPDKVADELLAFFDHGAPGIPGIGGSIEPLADDDGVLLTDDDGVLLAESDAAVMAHGVAALDADTEVVTGSERSAPDAQFLS
jgi:type IV secretion system protein VirD4